MNTEEVNAGQAGKQGKRENEKRDEKCRCLAGMQGYTSSDILPFFSSFLPLLVAQSEAGKQRKGKPKSGCYTASESKKLERGEPPKEEDGFARLMLRDGCSSMWIRPSCIGRPTSHLLLQAQYDLDGLLQDDKLGLGLVALQVDLTHPAQLSEGFVNVAHAHPLPSVVCQAALALPLLLLLGSEVLISHRDNAAAARRRRVGGGGRRGEGLVNKPESQPVPSLAGSPPWLYLYAMCGGDVRTSGIPEEDPSGAGLQRRRASGWF